MKNLPNLFCYSYLMKEKNVCSKCLEAVNEAYLRYQKGEIDEEGRIHGHEHVHEHAHEH